MSMSIAQPADRVHGSKFERRGSLRVHRHHVHAARPRFVDVPALGIAGIYDSGFSLCQFGPGVHMAQGPVVDGSVLEVGQAARRVGIVVRLAADVGMEQGDVEIALRQVLEMPG